MTFLKPDALPQSPLLKGIASQASAGRTFIYVLTYNTPQHPHKTPFYAGESSNLSRRFRRHAAISWHIQTFNQLPTLKILGTVKKDDAVHVLKKLNRKLAAIGVLYTGMSITPGASQLHRLSTESLSRYLKNPKPFSDTVLQDMELSFQKTVKPESSVAVPVNPINFSSLKVSPELLLQLTSNRQHRNSNVMLLFKKLAQRYDPATGESFYKFRHSPNSEKRNQLMLKEATELIQAISADWKLCSEKICVTERLIFTPTEALLAAAHVHQKKQMAKTF